MTPRPPTSTLFPYTTLFRSLERTYAATPAPKWVVAVGDCAAGCGVFAGSYACVGAVSKVVPVDLDTARSEEHTSELQSRLHLVCRLLLEKKKNIIKMCVQ